MRQYESLDEMIHDYYSNAIYEQVNTTSNIYVSFEIPEPGDWFRDAVREAIKRGEID